MMRNYPRRTERAMRLNLRADKSDLWSLMRLISLRQLIRAETLLRTVCILLLPFWRQSCTLNTRLGTPSPPILVFLFGRNRTVPVWLDNLKVVEEAFDPNLNPIRVSVELVMRVRAISEFKKGSNRIRDLRRSLKSQKEGG